MWSIPLGPGHRSTSFLSQNGCNLFKFPASLIAVQTSEPLAAIETLPEIGVAGLMFSSAKIS